MHLTGSSHFPPNYSPSFSFPLSSNCPSSTQSDQRTRDSTVIVQNFSLLLCNVQYVPQCPPYGTLIHSQIRRIPAYSSPNLHFFTHRFRHCHHRQIYSAFSLSASFAFLSSKPVIVFIIQPSARHRSGILQRLNVLCLATNTLAYLHFRSSETSSRCRPAHRFHPSNNYNILFSQSHHVFEEAALVDELDTTTSLSDRIQFAMSTGE